MDAIVEQGFTTHLKICQVMYELNKSMYLIIFFSKKVVQ